MNLQKLLSVIRVWVTHPLPSQQLHFCSGCCGIEKEHLILEFFILHRMVPDPTHSGHSIILIGMSQETSSLSLLFLLVSQLMEDMYLDVDIHILLYKI